MSQKNNTDILKSINALIFDAGDILFKVDLTIFEIYKILQKFNYKKSLNYTRNIWKKNIMKKNFNSFKDAVVEFLNLLNIDQDSKKKIFEKLKYKFTKRKKRLFPGIKKTLKILKDKGFKLAVLTNTITTEKKIRENYKLLGINYFDAIICSCDIHFAKPQKEAYIAALKKLNSKPSETIFVGHDKDELEGAKKVGIITMAFNWSEEIESDFFIEKFSDILKILEI